MSIIGRFEQIQVMCDWCGKTMTLATQDKEQALDVEAQVLERGWSIRTKKDGMMLMLCTPCATHAELAKELKEE